MSRVRWTFAVSLGLAATACGDSGGVAPGGGAPPPPPGVRVDGAASAVRAASDPALPERPGEVVGGALGWLLSEQRPDGSWSADDAPPGSVADDVSATSLSLLAFSSVGYTHRSEGPIGAAMGRAFRWLRTVQDADGRFRPTDAHGSARHDALATLALVESCGMTGSTIHRDATQRALDALVASGAAAPRGAADVRAIPLEAFGYAVAALRSAQLIVRSDAKAGREATFRLDDRVLEPARAWLAATHPASSDEAWDVATRVFVRGLVGYGRDDLEALRRDVLLLAKHPTADAPESDLSNRVAWIGTLGSCNAGDPSMEVWFPRVAAWLDAATPKGADASGARGSYTERGPLATRTGRVEATAFGGLARPPICTAYLGHFPGTEPEPEPKSESTSDSTDDQPQGDANPKEPGNR